MAQKIEFKFRIGNHYYNLIKFKEHLSDRQFDELLKEVIEKTAGKSLITKEKEKEYIKYLEKEYRA